MMSDRNFDKFKSAFGELLHVDQADLDFGIYRIMKNAKRGPNNPLP